MDARERFEATREAVKRLDEINLRIMFEDDWKPEGARSSHEISDPTANRAIYRVDERTPELESLIAERDEKLRFIGESGDIIRAVRNGFNEQYADWLEHRYIDLWTWAQFADKLGMEQKKAREKVRYWCGVTCDWIDSVGMSKLLRGQHEL